MTTPGCHCQPRNLPSQLLTGAALMRAAAVTDVAHAARADTEVLQPVSVMAGGTDLAVVEHGVPAGRPAVELVRGGDELGQFRGVPRSCWVCDLVVVAPAVQREECRAGRQERWSAPTLVPGIAHDPDAFREGPRAVEYHSVTGHASIMDAPSGRDP